MNHSDFVATCEDAWKIIQSKHDDVPDAVIVVGTGGRRAPTLLGHFAKDAWEDENGDAIHEVLIVAEQLKRPPEDIFTTLLHEAVHGIASKRGIKDVSGKRHNKKFAALCYEVGLIPPEFADHSLGFSSAILSDDTQAYYQSIIRSIGEQLQVYRKLKLKDSETKKTTWLAECECERKIRLPKKTIESGGGIEEIAITCQICQTEFKVTDDDTEAFKGEFQLAQGTEDPRWYQV